MSELTLTSCDLCHAEVKNEGHRCLPPGWGHLQLFSQPNGSSESFDLCPTCLATAKSIIATTRLLKDKAPPKEG